MTVERFQKIEIQGGIVDLSSRAKYRFTGSDRVRYLNGQVTNDVRHASPTETQYACVTDAKGRIAGDVFIHSGQLGEALWLDAESCLRETLGPRLERYIIADDVEFADVTDEWQLWHVFGPAAGVLTPGAGGVLNAHRLGVGGADVWLAPSVSPPIVDCPVVSDEEFETLRILAGVPRFPNELDGNTFPPEAGIESRAMSYTKGCYLGQEVLSRIRTTGKMPRQLVHWRSQSVVATGETVFSGAEPATAVGRITSSCMHPVTSEWTGLAYVKQGSVPLHSKLPVGADQPRIDAAIEMFAIVN